MFSFLVLCYLFELTNVTNAVVGATTTTTTTTTIVHSFVRCAVVPFIPFDRWFERFLSRMTVCVYEMMVYSIGTIFQCKANEWFVR